MVNNFKQNGGKREFKRPSFGAGNFNRGGRDSGRPAEMHQATCADCNSICEVPFRPNGKKPVYCKNCFDKNGGQSPANTRNYSARPAYADRPQERSDNPSGASKEITKQLELMNTKLSTLIELFSAQQTETIVPAKKRVAKKTIQK